jgi:hypothetical protein
MPPLPLGSRRPDEHYLRIRLAGMPGRDNRDGIGAELTALLPDGRRILTQNANQSGYLSTASPIVHLGLGNATRLERLTILWPSGKLQDVGAIEKVDRTIVVEEAGLVQVSEPGRR